jgi:hypothetical protein
VRADHALADYNKAIQLDPQDTDSASAIAQLKQLRSGAGSILLCCKIRNFPGKAVRLQISEDGVLSDGSASSFLSGKNVVINEFNITWDSYSSFAERKLLNLSLDRYTGIVRGINVNSELALCKKEEAQRKF